MSSYRKDFVEIAIQTAFENKGKDIKAIYGTWFSDDETFFPEDEGVPPEHIGVEAMVLIGSDVDGGFGLWFMEGKPIEKFFEETITDTDEEE